MSPALDPTRPEAPRPSAPSAAAQRGGRKLRIASQLALVNSIGLGFCGVVSLAVELATPTLPLTGLALLAIAWNERRGRALLLAGDASAPRRLALNQMLLLVLVLAYCSHGAYVAWNGPNPLNGVLAEQPDLAEVLGDGSSASLVELTDWARNAALAVYGVVALLSLIFQVALALYYRSLARLMSDAPHATP